MPVGDRCPPASRPRNSKVLTRCRLFRSLPFPIFVEVGSRTMGGGGDNGPLFKRDGGGLIFGLWSGGGRS